MVYNTLSNLVMSTVIRLDNMRTEASLLAPQAALTSWIGHSITQVNILHAFGFGAAVGAISSFTLPLFSKLTDCMFGYSKTSAKVAMGLSTLVGGACAYGTSLGIASLGIVAAPITLSGAALCTGTLLASRIAHAYFLEAKIKFLINNQAHAPRIN